MIIWAGAIIACLAVAGGVSAAVLAGGSGHHHNAAASRSAASGRSAASPAPTTSGTIAGPPGPEGVPLEQGSVIAAATGAANGATVDGVECNSNEQTAYHIHTHLAVYFNGALRPLPPGIGIVEPEAEQTAQGAFYQASHCFYWLHVHAQDGIIHIESPRNAGYTLGQFFAIWRQPISTTQVGPLRGPQQIFIDGKPYRGDPAAIPLKSHEEVQIDIGKPSVPPQTINWAATEL